MSLDFIILTPDQFILTANERLSRRLHQRYALAMKQQGHQAWRLPNIMSLAHWYQHLYMEAIDQSQTQQKLLNETQVYALWMEILSEALKEKDLPFIHLKKTVFQIHTAFQRLCNWRLSVEHPTFEQNEETRLFKACVRKLQEKLTHKSWLIKEQIPTLLSTLDLKTYLPAAKDYILFGFNEITPQDMFFLTHLEQYGCHYRHFKRTTEAALPQYHVAQSLTDEYVAMAKWAKRSVEQGKKRIACIIPELHKTRALLRRAFNQVFYPHHLFLLEQVSAPFNISGGIALDSVPLIHIMDAFLSLYAPETPYSTFAEILCSPFIAGAETERFARIALEYQLRKKTFKFIAPFNQNLFSGETEVPLFEACWKKISTLKPSSHLQSLWQWIAWLNQLLLAWGWPGERLLKSAEFQQVQKWREAMDRLLTLDQVIHPVDFKSFMAFLRYELQQCDFQIQTHDAPIQVLGILEASGDDYDAIWVANLTDNIWPPSANPNPYLPYGLQKSLHMPHATNQREYLYSETMINEWLSASEDIHFSYAEYDKTEAQEPSPFLQKNHPLFIPIESEYGYVLMQTPINDVVEYVSDPPSSRFIPMPEDRFSSHLLEEQVNCPFQAFAIQRLKAEPYPHPRAVTDPRNRGTLLHRIMEKLWQTWLCSETLASLSVTVLAEHIEKNCEKALHLYLKQLPPLLYADYFFIEKERLMRLIGNFIDMEKNRPAFEIHALEVKKELILAGLHFRLTIDRIDKLENGTYLLLDYKSRLPSLQAWLSSPPTQPQLLLYAMSLERKPDAIAYAALDSALYKMGYAGFSAEDLDIAGIRPRSREKQLFAFSDWTAVLSQWENELTHIIQAFMEGEPEVRPLTPQTCERCHLASLCRIHEQ